MKELIRFQTDRGLDKKDYKGINEHVNIVEELLESMGLDVPKENRPDLKAAWEIFVQDVVSKNIATDTEAVNMTDEACVDAYCDIITFATGAILKLGHNPEIAISECGKEINSRIGEMVDGKFEKDLSDEAKVNWYEADYSKSKL
jgi:hypothetical protein